MQGQRRPDPRDQGSVLGNYGHSPPVSATYPCTVQYNGSGYMQWSPTIAEPSKEVQGKGYYYVVDPFTVV